MMSTVDRNEHTHSSSIGHDLAASAWLDTHFLAMQPEYEEMLRWVGIQPGWHLLDAACGSGSFLPLMTELVGAEGQVSAIDLAPENVQVVEARAAQSDWPAPVAARVGDILALPYTDQSFDAVWCANTTQYLSDTEVEAMLQEFRRVVRPGGLIAIKEFDLTAHQIQPTPPTLFAHSYEAMWRKGDPYYYNLFRAIHLAHSLRRAGLLEIREKPTLMVRFQPLRAIERQFICEFLPFAYSQAQEAHLPADELQIWQTLAHVDDPNHITHHPDFQYRAIQTVFVGQVP